MTEMALSKLGQYAHSNQPVHGYPFLYGMLGASAKTSYLVHRIAHELYSLDNLPGDDDNGEMSAWYIFACLGIYPFCPGKSEYVKFDSIVLSSEIHIPNVGRLLLFDSEQILEDSDCDSVVITHQQLIHRASLNE
jgi:putative alpha-1,2-mannosidase